MNEKIIESDFKSGFVVGWQVMCGTAAGIPGIPGKSGTPGNSTEFLEGVKAGLRAAGVDLTKG